MQFPSSEQTEKIHNYVLIPLVIRVLQYDLKVIEGSSVKFKSIYADLIHHTIEKAESELRAIKKSLRTAGIKIYEEKTDEKGIYLKYLFKGYHHSTQFVYMILRHEVEKMIKLYFIDKV